MHSIHTTPGFVIHSRSRGEAGKLLSIFTRNLGLIAAAAQGIRLEKSKLRPFIQDYAFGQYAFVRGREWWRLTDARGLGLTSFVSGIELMARLALLLRRFLHGEEAHPELFDCVLACSQFLGNHGELDEREIQTLESLTVARMLHKLGYIGDEPKLDGHLKGSELSVQSLGALNSKRALINRHINKALRESHL